METLAAIASRTSTGVLTEPAPPADVLEKAFAAALRAPDHRTLRPWRFITIQGEGLKALGSLFVSASAAQNPELTEAELARLQQLPLRAPMIVVAVTQFQEDAKVPHWEQILSTGAAVQNLLLALHDQGYAAMWRTGAITENPQLKAGLDIAPDAMVAGFIYVGTAGSEKKITSLNTADFVRSWP